MNHSFQKKFETNWQGKKLVFEIDQLATKSEKSILCRYGNTTVLTALCLKKVKEPNNLNFVPLTIFFEEKFYSVGKIPAVFSKREGKPDYNSITIARLIDRSLRNFLSNQYEIQITNSVLSFDPSADPRIAACWNSILVCYLSPQLVTFNQLLATSAICKNQKKLVCNPSIAQLDEADFELIITSDRKNIVMIELEAKEITEKELYQAIAFAQKENQKLIHFFKQISVTLEVKKNFLRQKKIIKNKTWEREIKKSIKNILSSDNDNWLIKEKKLQMAFQQLKAQVSLSDNFLVGEFVQIWDYVLQKWMHKKFQKTQQRIDGRRLEEIRPLNIQIDYLPSVHGSALFCRGETRVLSVITLGKSSEKQLIDNIFVHAHKHFIHHYNFPAFAVNEITSFKSLSRREIGHGQLIEKTFLPLLPLMDEFPYTIRAVSEVLSSDGSSSQAAICATTLALIAAGVNLLRPVVGISLGLWEEKILVDLNSLEDKLGEMDCKIAGTQKGICSLQLDVKNHGISLATFQQACEQGKKARIYLLHEINQKISAFRPQLVNQVSKFKKILVGADRFGLIIGNQGKIINQLTQLTGVTVDLQSNGFVFLYHHDEQQLIKAVQFIEKKLKK